jgi:hypothetical protein
LTQLRGEPSSSPPRGRIHTLFGPFLISRIPRGLIESRLINGARAPGKFRLMQNDASNRYLRAHSRQYVTRLHLSDNLALVSILLSCEDTIGSGDGSNIVADGPYGDAIATTREEETYVENKIYLSGKHFSGTRTFQARSNFFDELGKEIRHRLGHSGDLRHWNVGGHRTCPASDIGRQINSTGMRFAEIRSRPMQHPFSSQRSGC